MEKRGKKKEEKKREKKKGRSNSARSARSIIIATEFDFWLTSCLLDLREKIVFSETADNSGRYLAHATCVAT